MAEKSNPCTSFEDLLLGRAGPADIGPWLGHLEECGRCRAQWKSHQALGAAFAAEAVPQLSPGFDDGLQRRLRAATEVRPLSGWRRAAMLAYAAVAALALTWVFEKYQPVSFDPSSPWLILAAIAAVPLSIWLTIGVARRLPPRFVQPPLVSLCLSLLVLLVAGCASTETSEPQLLRQSYQSPAEGEQRDYFVYLPAGYTGEDSTKWPVMLFLHGNGERGDAREELDFVLMHGPLYEAWIQKRDLPFIIVSPQLPLYGQEHSFDYIRDRKREDIPRRLEDGIPPRPEEFLTPDPMMGAVADFDLPESSEGPPAGWNRLESDLLLILDSVMASFRTDPARVYLTGISYGGFGTWYIGSRYPERFAAISPVVAWGHPELMPALAERNMPLWVFAGGRDPSVSPRFFYPGLQALEELGHTEVRFTIHEDMGHDAWRRVYAGSDLYDWLLEHRLTPTAGEGVR